MPIGKDKTPEGLVGPPASMPEQAGERLPRGNSQGVRPPLGFARRPVDDPGDEEPERDAPIAPLEELPAALPLGRTPPELEEPLPRPRV